MGVNELWQILEPVKEHTDLHSLGGKTIAVDLSLWVCEALTVKKMIGAVMKPHLRNLFFRISFLTLMDVKLVFVMEGEPPKLKADVISRRNQIRYGTFGKTWSQTTGRSHFKSVLRECLGLLECLGIPWVQATGEAEAMCAYLNANGYVNGCLTNDGDAFLYGAQTVYRNFTMNTKDPHVDCYTMSSISNKLGLDREALVGLAVLLGCDYLPKGVPGVGKEQALKLIQTLRGQSLLQRFNQWNEESCYSDPQTQGVKKRAHCSVCCHPGSPKDHERGGCKLCKSDRYCEPHDYEYCCPCEWHRMERDRQLCAVENNIKKKACSCEGFPFHEVIQEFLWNKDKLRKVIRYQRPDLLLFQRFTFEKMEWPGHYACEKLLVLLTHYDMMERKLGRRNCNQLQPIRIVKTRIRNGIHCFEIEWEKPGHYTTRDTQHGELTVQTVEEQSLFEAAYPEIVALYQKHKLEIKKKKPKNLEIKPKGNDLPESDDVISLQSHISLKPTCETFPKQNSKTRLEISPSSKLPQESISQSPTTLLLPEDASCLDIEDELMSSPRPLTVHQKTVNKCLTSESSQPDTFSHNVSVIADLHLSSIDWESTSFGNSPAIQRNIVSHSLKSDLDMSCPGSISCIEEQSYDSEWYTTNINKTSSRNLQKSNSVEHLLSDMTDLHLQDLPLKERICIKSLYPQGQVRPHDALKTLSLPKAKESCISNSSSACPSHLSKNLLPTVHLQNESRNCEVLTGDQALRENYKTNTPLNHGSKIDVQTTQKIVMKKSVCLDRHSSDEESAPVFGKAKYTTQKMKQYSQKRNPTQFKKSDSNKLSSHKIHTKETQECVQAYKLAGNVENCSTGPSLSSLHFLQCREEKEDPTTCLDSPLPLCQRLKLRFQST